MTAPRPSVLDALFGDQPDDARRRFGLPRPSAVADGVPLPDARTSGARNAGIKAQKAATTPETAGDGPSTPWELSRASWVEIIKRLYGEISKDRVTSVSAGVTFFGLLALFPALTAFVSIYGLFFDSRSVVGHLEMLSGVLPEGGVEIIRDQIVSIVEASSGALGLATVIGLLTALYSANGGMKALIEALNVAWFETEARGFIKLNLVSLALTLGAILLILTLLAMTAVVPPLLEAVRLGGFTEAAVRVLRWPLMAGALIVALAALYRFGPSKTNPQWQWISPGAVFATLGLILASAAFSWYAANFANYTETYGALGAVIGLMMWLWIAAMVVMMGAEMNAEVERQIQKENGIPLEDDAAKGAAA